MPRLFCPVCRRDVPRGYDHCPRCHAGHPAGPPEQSHWQPAQPPVDETGSRLTVVDGELEGRTSFSIGVDGVTIGRQQGNTVLLPVWDDYASRHHARLMCEAGRFYIEDMGSTNGVLVNGRRVAREELRPGDEIQLSATALRFEGPPAGGATVAGHMPDELLPAAIGPYRVRDKFRDGSMAFVYLAEDPSGQYVALKVPRPEFRNDPVFRQRFENEMEDGKKLSANGPHPNIVYVHDSSGHEDRGLADTIVMEYLNGGSLRPKIPNGPQMDVRDAGWIVGQCSRGLAYAHHEHGIVHRDVKPENILFDGSGWPKLVDFGIAHHMSRKTVITGQIMGTPYYMSPEQASPPAFLDHRSDIYSLGAVWYELLTGQPPFVGGFWEVMDQHKRGSPVPPSSFRGDIPSLHEAMIMRCLEKDPGRRPGSAIELAECLQVA